MCHLCLKTYLTVPSDHTQIVEIQLKKCMFSVPFFPMCFQFFTLPHPSRGSFEKATALAHPLYNNEKQSSLTPELDMHDDAHGRTIESIIINSLSFHIVFWLYYDDDDEKDGNRIRTRAHPRINIFPSCRPLFCLQVFNTSLPQV